MLIRMAKRCRGFQMLRQHMMLPDEPHILSCRWVDFCIPTIFLIICHPFKIRCSCDFCSSSSIRFIYFLSMIAVWMLLPFRITLKSNSSFVLFTWSELQMQGLAINFTLHIQEQRLTSIWFYTTSLRSN